MDILVLLVTGVIGLALAMILIVLIVSMPLIFGVLTVTLFASVGYYLIASE
jgi:hypothetical protein